VPSERYRIAREQMAGMPTYSTREGRFGGGGRARTGASAAAAPGVPSIGTWGSLGPGNIGGRTRAIAIDPLNPNTMYAGGVAGGVWRTNDGGNSWTPVGSGENGMENQAVTSLAMRPLVPNTLLAGTGEGFSNLDAVRGAGIFRTTNGGTNWTQIDSPGTGSDKTCEFHYVNDIVFSADGQRAYAAVGFSTGCDGARTGGVYRADSGSSFATWTRIQEVTVDGGCLDLAITGNDVLYAACGNSDPVELTVIVKSAAAQSASIGSGWTDLTLLDPVLQSWTPWLGRVSLAIAPSDPNVVYAIGADYALFDFLVLARSTTGGEPGTWEQRSAWYSVNSVGSLLFTNTPFGAGCFGPPDFTSQGWYDNVIAVDPSDSNVVWVGGVDLFRSDDGGQTFGLASFWWADRTNPGDLPTTYTHSDQHFLTFSNGELIVGNDGGIFRVADPSANVIVDIANVCDPANGSVLFENLNNGYGVTQFYYGAVFPDDTQYFGGTQDNGTIHGQDGGPNAWTEIQGGDGGAVAVDPVNPDILYAENTDLSIQKCVLGPLVCAPNTADWLDATSGISGDNGFLFIAPFVMDPSAPVDDAARQRLWTGGSYLWRTQNGGNSWQKASAKVLGSVSAIAVAASNPNFALAGTAGLGGSDAGGRIYRTSAGLTVGASVWPSSKPRSGYVSSVTFDPWNQNIAYATYSTFGGVHVWKSTNAGASWSPLDGSGSTIPDIPVHSIVVDPTNSSRLYVGTDMGVFVTTDGGANWAKENTGFGNVVTEHLVINGANLYAFTHGRGVWRVPLTNATQAVVVELEQDDSTVVEEDTNQLVMVRLRTSNHLALGSPVTVAYTTVPLTATPGSDYTETSGTLTFLIGHLDGDPLTIAIPILENDIGEPTERFKLTLSSPSAGAGLGRSTHTVRIDDDGDPPGVSIGDVTVTEGNIGVVNATFRLVLSGPVTSATTINFATQDGSATKVTDYSEKVASVTLPAGAVSGSIQVQVISDTLAEPSQQFFVNLTGFTGGPVTLDDAQGQATILDNDVSGTVEFASASYTVGEKGPVARIMLKRTGGTASGVSVQVATQDGSASSPADFTALAPPLAVGFGTSASAILNVPIAPDTLDEPTETVLLRIVGSPTGFGVALGPQQTAILGITDDDMGGQLKFAAATYKVNEGGSVDLIVIRSGGAAGAVAVAYSVTGGTAMSPSDFTLGGTGTLTFAPGETRKVIPLTAGAGGAVEGNETIVVTLASPTGGATVTGSTTTVTIADADNSFAFSAGSYLVKESQRSLVVTVRRTGDLSAPATVNYAATGGGATEDVDFALLDGTLAFAPKVPTRTFVVTILPDATVESDEPFALTLSSPTGPVGLGAPSVNVPVTIKNDDLGGVLQLAAATYKVLESRPSVLLTVKRTGGMAYAQVNYSTNNGSATSPADFGGVGPTALVIPAGRTLATFSIPIVQDLEAEGNHDFTVSLSSPSAGASLGAVTSATVTITDDTEPVLAFASAKYNTKELASGNANLVLTVKRTGDTLPAVSVNYAILGSSTATNGADFTLSAGPLNFASGVVARTIPISIHADGAYEGTETIGLELQAPTGAGLGAIKTTTVNVTDEDPVVSLSALTYKVTEPRGSTPGQAVITVRRTGNLGSSSAVPYAVSSGSAGPLDFGVATPPSPLTFLSGQASAQIKVPILPDSEDENAESFTITLSPPTGAFLGTPSTATITINDNDVAGRIQLKAGQWSVAEGAGNAVLTLMRSGGAAGESRVTCATDDGAPANTAIAGADYTSTSQLVTFGPSQTTATCTIPITGDSTPGEGAETVRVFLGSPSFGVMIGAVSSGTLYIADDE
jgi:Calx-beta domain